MEFQFNASGNLEDVRGKLNDAVHNVAGETRSSEEDQAIRAICHAAAHQYLDPKEPKLQETRNFIAHAARQDGKTTEETQKAVQDAPQPQVSLTIEARIVSNAAIPLATATA